MADFRSSWVTLELEIQDGAIGLSFRDGLGHRFRTGTVLHTSPVRFAIPPRAIELIGKLSSGLPSYRTGPHNTGPVPLAVFVGLRGLGDEAVVWHELVSSAFKAGIDLDRVEFARLTRSLRPSRPRFRLPFQILTLGSPGEFGLDRILSRPWFVLEPLLKSDGIRIETSSRENFLKDLSSTPRDVLFVRGFDDPAFQDIGSLPLNIRPRLIVHCSGDVSNVPHGVSLIHVPEPSVTRVVGSEILYGLIHDLPLHETVKSAKRNLNLKTEITLFSNPGTNNDLRISDSLRLLRANAVRVRSNYSNLSSPRTLDRLKLTAPHLHEMFANYSSTISLLNEAASGVLANTANFNQESTGLTPLVAAQTDFSRAMDAAAGLQSQLANVRLDPDVRRALVTGQHRYVDVALERLETDPFFEAVTTNFTLQASASYQLRIHIGDRLPGSLVRGEAPSIDPLLPPLKHPDGHKLEIAVQRKQFSMFTKCQKSVLLPSLGGSDPIYFTIRAPRRTGPATLRILIYYRNQLLQSFLLSTNIMEFEEFQAAEVTHVTLECSRTARYANLDQLQPRALSISANRGIDGTHELFIKGVQAGSVPLGDEAFVRSMQEIRDILLKATVTPGDPTVPISYPQLTLGGTPLPEFSAVIRSLADKGHDIYSALFRAARSSPALLKSLHSLRDTRSETIQIVRLYERVVIPWTVLYDFEPPQTGIGEICLGRTLDEFGKPQECSHKPQDRVYCLRGFWGIRHYVEELIRGGPEDDAVRSITRPDSAEPICMAIDTTVHGASEMRLQIAAELGDSAIRVPIKAEDLLSLLWQKPPKRPSVLVILGHLETGEPQFPNEPKGERIVLEKERNWLTHQSISNSFIAAAEVWSQPRSLVLLMACASATTSVDKINDFVLALNAAGAGAVVGTECVVFSDLACKFAQNLTLRLWQRKAGEAPISLGQAMTDFRVSLLQSGNPLAFVFRSIGDADLTLQA